METKLPLGCCRESGMGVKTSVGLEFCLVASPACKAPKSGRELSVVLSPKKNGVEDAKIGAGNCIDRETHRRTEAKGHTMFGNALLPPTVQCFESASEARRSPVLSMSEKAFAIL